VTQEGSLCDVPAFAHRQRAGLPQTRKQEWERLTDTLSSGLHEVSRRLRGKGARTAGRAFTSLDATFAETVSLGEPYHVFVQPYGKAELYVSRRAPEGFEVARLKGDKNVEFSFRIVAKRRGFERHRLERAPWADGDPNLGR
jgi:hypothetical protein